MRNYATKFKSVRPQWFASNDTVSVLHLGKQLPLEILNMRLRIWIKSTSVFQAELLQLMNSSSIKMILPIFAYDYFHIFNKRKMIKWDHWGSFLILAVLCVVLYIFLSCFHYSGRILRDSSEFSIIPARCKEFFWDCVGFSFLFSFFPRLFFFFLNFSFSRYPLPPPNLSQIFVTILFGTVKGRCISKKVKMKIEMLRAIWLSRQCVSIIQ